MNPIYPLISNDTYQQLAEDQILDQTRNIARYIDENPIETIEYIANVNLGAYAGGSLGIMGRSAYILWKGANLYCAPWKSAASIFVSCLAGAVIGGGAEAS